MTSECGCVHRYKKKKKMRRNYKKRSHNFHIVSIYPTSIESRFAGRNYILKKLSNVR